MMEEEYVPAPKHNATRVATKWAVINALTAIIITYAFELLNANPASPLKYLSYVPFVAFLCLTQAEFKIQIGGFMTYGESFSAGFRYSLFTGLIIAVFIYLYCTILSPGFFDKTLELSRAQMEEQNVSSEKIDKNMEMAKKYGPIFAAFGTAVLYPLLGAIISLITAAIFKKERSPYDILDEAIDPTL